ncbi:MAG: hypothetical protein SW833_25435 [Cyanobacteriota bacterium]|nr:hypothetical protein [Cyanobacteriota bacterium]
MYGGQGYLYLTLEIFPKVALPTDNSWWALPVSINFFNFSLSTAMPTLLYSIQGNTVIPDVPQQINDIDVNVGYGVEFEQDSK